MEGIPNSVGHFLATLPKISLSGPRSCRSAMGRLLRVKGIAHQDAARMSEMSESRTSLAVVSPTLRCLPARGTRAEISSKAPAGSVERRGEERRTLGRPRGWLAQRGSQAPSRASEPAPLRRGVRCGGGWFLAKRQGPMPHLGCKGCFSPRAGFRTGQLAMTARISQNPQCSKSEALTLMTQLGPSLVRKGFALVHSGASSRGLIHVLGNATRCAVRPPDPEVPWPRNARCSSSV